MKKPGGVFAGGKIFVRLAGNPARGSENNDSDMIAQAIYRRRI